DEETFSENESVASEESNSDDQLSDLEADCQLYSTQPCKYYNSGGCKKGSSCSYQHVCRYFLTGNCKYGANCKLKHGVDRRPSSGASGTPDGSAASNPKLTNGRFYQWQLNDGSGWKDITNDHVIEAQYSLPHTKSIKLYNTPYGAVSINFNRMRVYGKDLKVRRLDDGNTVWCWYCTLRRKWIRYGEKDSKGNSSPVKSLDIEKKFQSNPTSSYTFSVGGKTFEIRFPGDVSSPLYISSLTEQRGKKCVAFNRSGLLLTLFVRNETGGWKEKEESHTTTTV
uniref:Si:ch211-244b2.4 n=1 Tax=Kryptolebias marmoratus TaxID=37003 RepID=A0A3Q3A7T1_KRYMA